MFANPLMLLGLGLAVLPIVVHLLSRARYRTVDWGAMMFLDGVDAAQSAGRRFNQWLLLLIRAGIVALLALALARPEWQSRSATGIGVAPTDSRRHVAVILLDCSASMSFEEDGRPRMAAARDAAKQILGLHRGDRVAVVLMGRDQPELERLPTADLWEAGRRVESAEPGTGRADIARGLRDALEAIAPAQDGPVAASDRLAVTFYVVADRQADNWRAVLDAPPGEWAGEWRQRLASAGVAGRVVVLPIGSAEAGNLAVTSVSLIDPPAVAGHAVELDITVQNRGPVQWAQVPLIVTVDRRTVVSEQKINLAPDQQATYRVALKAGFASAGTHVVSADVNPQPAGVSAASPPPMRSMAGLSADDRFDLVVDVRDPVRVLVISGDEPPAVDKSAADKSATRTLRSADYLAAALMPYKSARRTDGVDACTVDVGYADQWTGPALRLPAAGGKKSDPPREAALSQYDVVVLTGIERIGDAQTQALERFVEEGGGLLVSAGEVTRLDELDHQLFADGAGLLPASLQEPTSADWIDQTSLLGFESHPALRFLGGRPDSFLSVVIGRYFPVGQLSGSARVLMRYATGDPFLVEMPSAAGVRRGRVMLLTTALEADWTTLPMTGFYVPLMQSLVRYLGESQPRTLNIIAGDAFELPLTDAAGDGRVVRIRPPDSPDERQAEVVRVGGKVVARFTDTATPGVYQVRITEPGKRAIFMQVAANAPREEVNLAGLSTEQWERVEQEVDARLVDPAVAPITAALPAPLELWPFALGAVFLLGLAEMKLARNWSRTEPVEESA
jgi:hypothetical protein